MEFFREKNGRYLAGSLSGNASAGPAMRIVMFFVAAAVFLFVVFLSPMRNSFPDRTPLIIAMGAAIIANMVILLFRRAGHGSDMIVDQTNHTVSFRNPGGIRYTVPLNSLKGIVMTEIPMKISYLSLEKKDGDRYILMNSKDTMKMRMFANELASLTSLTVSEEMDDQ